jgi:hypothetical protein
MLLTPVYVCPSCGSDVWVAYSNQSGDLTGNNPQFQHPSDFPLDLDPDPEDPDPADPDPEEEDPDEEAPKGVDPIGF